MKYNKQVQEQYSWSLKIQKLKLLQHNLKISMFSNNQINSVIETLTKSIIVENKLKSKIDVL